MSVDTTSLEDLCAELRKSATTDVDFAPRVAMVCTNLLETKAHAATAIRKVFRIQ